MEYINYILGFLAFILLLKIFVDSDYFFLTCIESSLDNEKYCVRHRENINDAVNLLSNMNIKLKQLVEYVHNKYPNKDNVKRLYEKYNPKRVVEINPLRKGLFSPGSHLEVIMENELSKSPDVFYVLAWNFKEEILKKNHELIKAGTEFYFPVEVKN